MMDRPAPRLPALSPRLLAALLLALAAGASWAQSPPAGLSGAPVGGTAAGSPDAGQHGPRQRLKAADINKDGMISREEARTLPRLAQNFDQIDANRDGQVSRAELRAFREQHRAGIVGPGAAK